MFLLVGQNYFTRTSFVLSFSWEQYVLTICLKYGICWGFFCSSIDFRLNFGFINHYSYFISSWKLHNWVYFWNLPTSLKIKCVLRRMCKKTKISHLGPGYMTMPVSTLYTSFISLRVLAAIVQTIVCFWIFEQIIQCF